MKNPPVVPTTGKTYKTIVRRISKRIRKCDVNDFPSPLKIVDAGCGYGTLLIPLAKEFPQHQFVGIEYAWFAYRIAKFRARKLQNIQIVYGDIFEYDFSQVDFVICFLLSSLMPKFSQKCFNELHKKSYIFANRFALTGLEPMEKIDLGDDFSYIYLYKYLKNES
ncbi:MAG: class I SAM-dependent methyltransferase [Alphaproteobacteria bacterium]